MKYDKDDNRKEGAVQSTLGGNAIQQEVEEMSTLDRLEQQRSRLIKEHSARIRELNRIITNLKQSDAENILKEAKGVLNEY